MEIKKFYLDYESTVIKESRYRSWEFVWAHIQRHSFKELYTTQLELTALHIGYYLGSWGMLRGAGELLYKNLDYFKELSILLFRTLPKKYPTFYQATFDDFQSLKFCDLFDEVVKFIKINMKLRNVTDTLVSKILLGVWGQIPAYDRFFKDGLSIYFKADDIPSKRLSGRSLHALWKASKAERWEKQFGKYSFRSGKKNYQYTLAKQIDMAFFQMGFSAYKK